MADERDREHVDSPSSDGVKGEKAADPAPTASTDQHRSTPQEAEADLLIEDRFEATDN
jgi:hypothetical protein